MVMKTHNKTTNHCGDLDDRQNMLVRYLRWNLQQSLLSTNVAQRRTQHAHAISNVIVASSACVTNGYSGQSSSSGSSTRGNTWRWLGAGGAVTSMVMWSLASTTFNDFDQECGVQYETGQRFSNWSSTHKCAPVRVYEPKSAQEVVRVLSMHHHQKRKIRPVGQALSPNGIGMSAGDSVLSVAAIDYVEVDKGKRLVTVGAGATVSAILKELKKHGLTLQNFSSIQEQQIGGWTQVAAHGTGVTLPTVEEMIVRMKLATGTEGLITLSNTSNGDLFRYAKVGLGCLGVVTEVTLQCIPCMNLSETTTILDRNQLDVKVHLDRLQNHRHVRYMWIPYTSTVVSVASNPTTSRAKPAPPTPTATQPLADLLTTLKPTLDPASTALLSFSQLRDQLLDIGPLDLDLVKRINHAEARYWQASTGTRIDDSTNILGFDCGGEQVVCEVCFPMGPLSQASALAGASSGSGSGSGSGRSSESKDISFVRRLLQIIESSGIAAPSPIEQRWTARSTAPLSPAYSVNADDVFCCVGVIMYLPPSQTDEQRARIRQQFEAYCEAMRPLMDEYQATVHWAKVELPGGGGSGGTDTASGSSSGSKSFFDLLLPPKQLDSAVGGGGTEGGYEKKRDELRASIAKRYDLTGFNTFRAALDPHRTLMNTLLEELLLLPSK